MVEIPVMAFLFGLAFAFFAGLFMVISIMYFGEYNKTTSYKKAIAYKWTGITMFGFFMLFLGCLIGCMSCGHCHPPAG